MISRVPESRILNMRFQTGQGKTSALAAIAYIGIKYGMFDRAIYLVKDRSMVRQFQECLTSMIFSEEDSDIKLDRNSNIIHYANSIILSSTFQSFRGWNVDNTSVVLIDEAHLVDENTYCDIMPVICRASCIVTTSSSDQKYFLSP